MSLFEVWASATNTFGSATKLIETPDPKFAEAGLPAEVPRHYWVRVARTFQSGDIKYSAPAGASATPLAATILPESVTTSLIAPHAVTNRSFYQEDSEEYVRAGTDDQGDLLDPSEGEWVLGDIPWVGDGSNHVVTCIAREKEMPVNFREGGSAVTAMMSASVLDVTDENEVLIDYAEMSVGAMRLDQFPVAPSQWVSSSHHRDFYHNFIIPTVMGRSYVIRFKMWCFVDNSDNYILWASNLRQVFWQVFKR
ncbi:hypothetical protein GGE65_007732 [Skermanella aerolata]|uniref:hypothetical protein n=1 Tax=Skermanella aerolata TaxID=393310 RepID=UPI003D1F78EA